MKKKVFFIMSTDDYSGAEAVNFSIIEGLKDKYDFYWVSKKGNINNYLSEKNVNWIEIKDLCVSEIKKLVKDYSPDILHATDFKASVICSFVKSKCYLISHLHNNSPWLSKICPYSFAFLFASLRSDIVLTVSPSIEKEYIFSKLVKKKIKCIGNPISRKKIIDRVDDINCTKIYDICCVARLTEAKNPYKFINIINKIKETNPEIKCVWIGKGELKAQSKEYAKMLGVDGNIDFVGFKKNPYPYIAKSKIFLLTSDWEGFGLVAYEALCFGLPCVVSNVGGLPTLINSKCGRLCNPKDESDYVSELNLLISDNDNYNNKSKEAIKQSIKLDNYENYIKIIDNCYKKLI